MGFWDFLKNTRDRIVGFFTGKKEEEKVEEVPVVVEEKKVEPEKKVEEKKEEPIEETKEEPKVIEEKPIEEEGSIKESIPRELVKEELNWRDKKENVVQVTKRVLQNNPRRIRVDFEPTGSNAVGVYQRLIASKLLSGINEDEAIVFSNILYENRDKLRNRFNALITIVGDKGRIVVECAGVLLEDLGRIKGLEGYSATGRGEMWKVVQTYMDRLRTEGKLSAYHITSEGSIERVERVFIDYTMI